MSKFLDRCGLVTSLIGLCFLLVVGLGGCAGQRRISDEEEQTTREHKQQFEKNMEVNELR